MIGQPRSTQRYNASRKTDEEALRSDIIRTGNQSMVDMDIDELRLCCVVPVGTSNTSESSASGVRRG